jgi:hypothetical protein
MDKRPRITSRFAAWKRRLHRVRLECRECPVICERVVSPQHCLDSGCSSVYVYEDDGTKMFGCLHKVFAPELDMAAFSEPGGRGRTTDLYGPIRVSRAPRRQCKISVEQAYPAALSASSCSNPTFFHHPAGGPDERMRLTTNLPPEPQTQDR